MLRRSSVPGSPQGPALARALWPCSIGSVRVSRSRPKRRRLSCDLLQRSSAPGPPQEQSLCSSSRAGSGRL
eukprot:13390377-Alexandrium_andersonii.AAC.1